MLVYTVLCATRAVQPALRPSYRGYIRSRGGIDSQASSLSSTFIFQPLTPCLPKQLFPGQKPNPLSSRHPIRDSCPSTFLYASTL
ncbi:hypothetical protein RSAG8_11311, partial [Rhizoctonia solani AG-8 WAC10335]